MHTRTSRHFVRDTLERSACRSPLHSFKHIVAEGVTANVTYAGASVLKARTQQSIDHNVDAHTDRGRSETSTLCSHACMRDFDKENESNQHYTLKPVAVSRSNDRSMLWLGKLC